MLPITPTSDWITNNQRRIVTPGDESIPSTTSGEQGLNNSNQFSLLEDTDSDDDVSISNTFAIETDAAFPIDTDTGATDHLIGAVERAVQIQRIRQVLGGDPITAIDNSTVQIQRIGQVLGDTSTATAYHLDIAEDYLNAPFEASATAEFNHLHQDSDSDTASTASSSTVSSYGSSMGQDIMPSMPSIDEYLPKEYQTAAKSNFNFADAVVFREALGNALAACQHADRDAGHSYLVDTPKRYGERYGDLSKVLPPPAEKTTLPKADALGGTWKRFYELKKMYVREDHWNKEALNATVRRFPSAMKEEKDDYGAMPLKYSVRQALNFIEGKVSDRVKKQKAYIDLMSNITARAYVPSTDGPVVYLKAMEHDKHCIDILSGSSTATFELGVVCWCWCFIFILLTGLDITSMHQEWMYQASTVINQYSIIVTTFTYKKFTRSMCATNCHIVPAVVGVVVVSYCLVDRNRTCIPMMWSRVDPPVIYQYSHVLCLNNAQKMQPLHTKVYRRCATNCHTHIYIVDRNMHNQNVPGGVDSPVKK